MQPRKTAIDRALDRAVQRVYDAYGPDVKRFIADVEQARSQAQKRVVLDKPDTYRPQAKRAEITKADFIEEIKGGRY